MGLSCIVFFIIYIHHNQVLELFVEEIPDDCVRLADVFLKLSDYLDIVGDILLIEHAQTDLIGFFCVIIRL